MSTSVFSGIVSRPSRVHNLAYVIFGYVVASTAISMKQTESLSEYLLAIGIVGGFVGILLFYVKPIEKLLLIVLRLHFRRSVIEKIPFASAFLIETKGKIIGGVYFSLTCLIINYNPNLPKIMWHNLWVRPLIIIVATIVLATSIHEATRLPERVAIVHYFYGLSKVGLTRVMPELTRALERGDWIEASIIRTREVLAQGQNRE